MASPQPGVAATTDVGLLGLTREQASALKDVTFGTSLFALLCDVVIMLSYRLYAELRGSQLNYIVLMIAVSNSLTVVGIWFGVGGLAAESAACTFQGMFIQAAFLATVCWNVVLSSFTLYVYVLGRDPDHFMARMRHLHVLCWGLPVVSAAVVASIPESYDVAGPWCWIEPKFWGARTALNLVPVGLAAAFALGVSFWIVVVQKQTARGGRSAAYATGYGVFAVIHLWHRGSEWATPGADSLATLTFLMAGVLPLSFGGLNFILFSTERVVQPGTLTKFLDVHAGLAAYRKFLCKEFGEESLDFVVAVRQFDQAVNEAGGAVTAAAPQRIAAHIRDTFVADDAPRQVNLPSGVVARVLEDCVAEEEDDLEGGGGADAGSAARSSSVKNVRAHNTASAASAAVGAARGPTVPGAAHTRSATVGAVPARRGESSGPAESRLDQRSATDAPNSSEAAAAAALAGMPVTGPPPPLMPRLRANTFAEAVDEILVMLERDSYGRFTRTEEHHAVLADEERSVAVPHGRPLLCDLPHRLREAVLQRTDEAHYIAKSVSSRRKSGLGRGGGGGGDEGVELRVRSASTRLSSKRNSSKRPQGKRGSGTVATTNPLSGATGSMTP